MVLVFIDQVHRLQVLPDSMQREAVDEIDVEAAVDVVVEEAASGSHRFDQVVAARGTAGVGEVDPRLRRRVDEEGGGHVRAGTAREQGRRREEEDPVHGRSRRRRRVSSGK